MLIKNAGIYLGRAFVNGDIRFSGTIDELGHIPGEADLDAGGGYLIPGLVDIHTHGARGEDFSDGRPEGLSRLSDWYATSRKKKLGPDMHIDVAVRETDRGLDVEIETSGVRGAPWRVELAFNGIDRIENAHMTMPVHGDEVLVLKDSDFTVRGPESSMEVGPAFGLHHFTEGKEDSEAKTPGAATVYLTDYTPFKHVISIRP